MDQGTIEGQAYPSVDVLNYIVDSATTAYGGTQPVIDTVNRTIAWTIASLPAETTDQSVSFMLITNSNYSASQKVGFTIGAYLTDTGTTVNAVDLLRHYQYNPALRLHPHPHPRPHPHP